MNFSRKIFAIGAKKENSEKMMASQNFLRGADGKVKVWEICTEFETEDEKRMEAYRRLFEDTGGTSHAKERKEIEE